MQCTIHNAQCTMKERTGVRLCPFGRRSECRRAAFVSLVLFAYMCSVIAAAGGLILVFCPEKGAYIFCFDTYPVRSRK